LLKHVGPNLVTKKSTEKWSVKNAFSTHQGEL
jgi:hypothetical protein